VLLQSDGTPWRPLVHIEDISRAFLAVMEAPRDVVHNRAYNVGATSENYRIREVAEMVQEVVPDSTVAFADGAGPDKRNYRVDCTRIETEVPAATAQWTVRKGVEQIYAAILRNGLDIDDLTGARFTRLKRIDQLRSDGSVDDEIRRTDATVAG
jgi:nucleoside-diphosphate-sugar epimerase